MENRRKELAKIASTNITTFTNAKNESLWSNRAKSKTNKSQIKKKKSTKKLPPEEFE